MKKLWVVLLALVATGAVVAATPAQPPPGFRFTGYVEGVGSGPGHAFVVGDGLHVAFRDDARARTRYRVCWSRQGGGGRRCWLRRTGRIGLASKIFTPAPGAVGVYLTRWYVAGRVVATWRFYNGPGD